MCLVNFVKKYLFGGLVQIWDANRKPTRRKLDYTCWATMDMTKPEQATTLHRNLQTHQEDSNRTTPT